MCPLGRYLRRRNRPERHLVKVEPESAAEAGTGFALVLRNGRRIESGLGFRDADLVRLMRVVEAE